MTTDQCKATPHCMNILLLICATLRRFFARQRRQTARSVLHYYIGNGLSVHSISNRDAIINSTTTAKIRANSCNISQHSKSTPKYMAALYCTYKAVCTCREHSKETAYYINTLETTNTYIWIWINWSKEITHILFTYYSIHRRFSMHT
jgi:late competence protein required for DNA uptake (superfamily II DNA/RNA helicase)